MSAIRIDTSTITEWITLLNQESEWYDQLLSCHRTLLDMIDNGVWQESEAEILAAEFYDVIICGYANPRKDILNRYANHLQSVTDNYTQAETSNF
ncbi:MAG: hypothetical protein FWF88_12055 [Peptococcaceae bacterium]|nr:hypothetical protein [Peptococcaceae bacterium]